jgi:hypothetical protein
MWEPRCLTTLWACTDCYRDSFTYYYYYSVMEDSEVVLVFELDNAGLKKLPSFVWTDKWLICLPEFHVSFKVCTQSGWTVTGLARIYCISLSCIMCSVPVASNGIFPAGTFRWLRLSYHWEDVSWAWSAAGESVPSPTYVVCTRAPSPQPLCMKVNSDS